jgi:hypothetical protein
MVFSGNIRPVVWISVLCVVFILGVLFFAARKETREQRDLNISEAVIRRLMDMPDVARFPQGAEVCIENTNQHFDDKFLKRFLVQFPRLRLGVRGDVAARQKLPVSNQGKCSTTISVGEIREVNASEVIVEANYYCGMLCGYGGRFSVLRKAWGWSVDTVSDVWVSDCESLPELREHLIEEIASVIHMETPRTSLYILRSFVR